ncbi:MAG: M48 family metalloprotease [Actinomycetota bacterium]
MLPIVAAVVYARAVLPEVAILEPPAQAITDGKELIHLLLLSDGRHQFVVPYALSGSAGPWLVAIGLSVSLFMLLRRFLGALAVRRLMLRSQPLAQVGRASLEPVVERVAVAVGLSVPPVLLVLPDGVSGVFAMGSGKGKILISELLLDRLDEQELEAVLAHEMAHLDAHDCRVVFLAGILRDMVAWNPIAHISFRRLAADREFEADRRAATVTGNPLAVASGLLKVCELVSLNPHRRSRMATAFLKPGGRVARRVRRLLALEQGGTVAVAGRAPYVVAACLASVLGLYSGARISANDTAFAVVLGGPDTAAEGALPLGRAYAPGAEEKRGAVRFRSGAKHARSRWISTSLRESPQATYPIKEKYVSEWLREMSRVARRNGVSAATWATQNWQARPLFSDPKIGPVGIYSVRPGSAF